MYKKYLKKWYLFLEINYQHIIQLEFTQLRIKTENTDEIKATCVHLLSECRLSVENSRLAVKIVGENLYNSNYWSTIPQ